MEIVTIDTENIQLDQLLKLAGIIQTGGQIKMMLADQLIFLNGNPVTERRKKVFIEDTVEIKGTGSWKVMKK